MGKMVDQSKIVAEPLQEPEEHLQRSLSNRHIQLIAIGGAIGTGLLWDRAKPSALPGRRSFSSI